MKTIEPATATSSSTCLAPENKTHEPRKRTSCFPLYRLFNRFNRDLLYNALLQSLNKWVGYGRFFPLIKKKQVFFHCYVTNGHPTFY